MRFILARETLFKPLQLVAGIVERRKTVPILSNILFKLQKQTLCLTATDLEIELTARIALPEAGVSGEITVPGRKLLDICRALPDQAKLEFELDNERMIIRSGRSRFTLLTLPAKDFPAVEDDPGQMEFTLPQQDLKFLIEHTHFAIAQQDVRYYLNGLLFEIEAGKIKAVASNGHRMAFSQIDVANLKVPPKTQIIIPRKGVLDLQKLLEAEQQEIEIIISKNHISVKTAEITMTSKLLDSRFPDYNAILFDQGDKIITVNREQIKQVLTRAAILSNEKFRGIRLQLRNGLLRVIANNPEHEEAEDQLEINYNQADLDIGFNVSYLLDALNVTHSDEIRLTFKDPNSGVVIEEIGQPGCMYIVMPMRL